MKLLQIIGCFLLVSVSSSVIAANKTILITGANRGLGLEFAKQYQAKGYNVIATARKPHQATALNKLGAEVHPLDVTNNASVKQLAKKLQDKPIDILINNAGILPKEGPIQTLDLDMMTKAFAVNSVGPVRVTQALLPNLKAGKDKKIVNITSRLGSITHNTGGIYSYRSSKAALNQLTRTMAIELGPAGFICVALHPGWVRTDMGGPQATYSPQESITGMMKVIGNLSKKDNGRFIDLQGGNIAW